MTRPPAPTWIVRRSRFPLALPGDRLGTVEAHTRTAAELAAGAQFDGAVTVELEPAHPNPALEKAVARAVQASTRQRTGAYGGPRSPGKAVAARRDRSAEEGSDAR
jgi:hypothetical protein